MIRWLRDANQVLDGRLYHERNLEKTEHYTDTERFAEHVFTLMPLQGLAPIADSTDGVMDNAMVGLRENRPAIGFVYWRARFSRLGIAGQTLPILTRATKCAPPFAGADIKARFKALSKGYR